MSAQPDVSVAMVAAVSDVVRELISRYERGAPIDVRRLCRSCAAGHGLKRSPKLVEVIAAIPEQWRRRLQPLVTAKPIRSASGISVVAVMCKPHRCPHIAMTGNICVYCFPERDTRVLTNHGLLFLGEIEALHQAGEDVLFGCYDVQSKALRYSAGRLVFPQRPPPCLLEFTSAAEDARWAEGSGDYGTEGVPEDNPTSRHVSLRVTPDHDMFVQTGSRASNGHVHWTSTRERDPVTKKQLLPVVRPHRKMQAQDLLSDDPRACVRMLACAQAGYQPQTTSRRDAVKRGLRLDDTQFAAFIELLGFWLGQGSMACSPAVNGSAAGCVCFSQVKQTDLSWLRSTFAQAGPKEDEHWLTGSSGSLTTLCVSEPAWVAFFDKEFGGKSVKHLPDWALQELPAAEMRLLISGLHRADGSFAAGENVIYTSSAHFRDQLVQALLHCGYSAYAGLMYGKGAIRGYRAVNQRDDAGTYSVAEIAGLSEAQQGEYVPIQAKADAWVVSWAEVINGRNWASPADACWPSLSRQQCVTEVPYDAEHDGRAWCVEVEHADQLIIAQRAHRRPNSYAVTKQSRPIVVGNCPGGPDSDFEYSTQAYTGYEVATARR